MTAVDIEWGAPPPKESGGARNTRTVDFVEQLKTRPHEWAKYPRTMKAGSSTSSYRHNYPGIGEPASRRNG